LPGTVQKIWLISITVKVIQMIWTRAFTKVGIEIDGWIFNVRTTLCECRDKLLLIEILMEMSYGLPIQISILARRADVL